MKLSKAIAFLATLALALAAAAPAFAADDAAQFIKHESQDAGYSVELPLEWDIKTGLKGYDCVAFSPKAEGGLHESVSIAAIDDKEGKGASGGAEDFIAESKAAAPSFSLLSRRELKVSGCDAVRIEYSHEMGAVKILASRLFVSKGARIWAVGFSGEAKRFIATKTLFDKIEASFKLL